MGVIIRGAKNAFRNTIRTLSVTLILAISIGLALIMLLSYQTVQSRIASVQSSIGNTISISPAGARGFEGGGEPLTQDQMDQVKAIPHVTAVNETLNDRLTPSTDTNLASAIDPGTLGNRFRTRGNTAGGTGGPVTGAGGNRTFTIPIQVTGLSDTSSLTSGNSKLTSGAAFDPTQDVQEAVVGSALATKNNLSVGSTFTAYGTTLTVKGISDAGNQFANSGIYLPIKTVQRLSSQDNQVSEATVQVDSITNIDATTQAIKDKLGTDKADVVSNADAAKQSLAPLENIKNISLYSLIGALVAGAVITLLTMIMVVRERRREIGVLKAIGSSNTGVVTQFVSEALVLTLLGSAVGMIVGVLFSNPVLNALVASSTSSVSTPGGQQGAVRVGGAGFARLAQFGGQFGGGVQNAVRSLHATVGWEIILYGILAAIGIAILGSALPSWFIAKIKPAEVMRGE